MLKHPRTVIYITECAIRVFPQRSRSYALLHRVHLFCDVLKFCCMQQASVFKGWKKRHFKAVGGKLYYYEVGKHS